MSQIECDSTSLPWQGCLQYYMGLEGLFFCPFLSFAKFVDLLFSSTLNCLRAFVSLFLLLLWPLEPSDECTRSTFKNLKKTFKNSQTSVRVQLLKTFKLLKTLRQVYSFNYFKPNDHLQDQHYNVCIRQEDGMCRWWLWRFRKMNKQNNQN